jgi:hypothetical protein
LLDISGRVPTQQPISIMARRADQLLVAVAGAAGELVMGVPSIPTTHHVPPCWVRP